MKNLIVVFALAMACAAAGCRHIEIDKHDPIPFPSATNAVAWIDGGYEFTYWNWGFKTDVDSISADKTKDGVRIMIGKIATDVSDRHEKIVGATGTAVGNVAQKVIDGVKGVGTVNIVE